MKYFTAPRILFAGGLPALILAGSMVAAHAEGPRYTYADLAYTHIKLDVAGRDRSGDGLSLGGSVAVAEMVHLFAGFTYAEFDFNSGGFGNSDIDYRNLTLGAGFNYDISSTVDFVGRLAYVTAEARRASFKVDEDGYGLSAGVRAMVTEQVELNGFVNYVDLGSDIGDDTSVSIGALYNFTDLFAVGLGGEFGGDARAITAGVRFYFGNR